MDLIFDDSSVINTKLMFFVETVKDTVELTLGFFDTYSVAFYLLFLY